MLSSSIFLILTSITSNRKIAYLCYAGCICILFIIALSVLPSTQSFQISENKTHLEQIMKDEEAQNKDDANNAGKIEDKTDTTLEPDEISQSASHTAADSSVFKHVTVPPTVMSQICSLEYILLLLWFSVCIVPVQFYIASIGFQLERKGDIDGIYTRFQQIMGASTFIASPIVGTVADKFGSGFSQGLANILCTCFFFILSSNISLRIQTVGIIAYSFGRLCTFSYFFCNVGKRFGYTNYGTLTG